MYNVTYICICTIYAYLGVPYVTLPVEYLKGRMGYAFLRTLNLPQLVAHNITHYIDISINLSKNITLYNIVTNIIRQNSDLLWEDMSYIHGWIQVLNTINGLPYISWEHFISTTSRNLTIETNRRDQRGHNSDLFDEIWGKEYYLLDSYGIARLETHLSIGQRPRVFNSWISQVSQNKDGGSRKCPPAHTSNNNSNNSNNNNNNISGLGHVTRSSSWINRLMLGQRGDTAVERAYRAQCYCLDDDDVDEHNYSINTSVDYVIASASYSSSDPAVDTLLETSISSITNDSTSAAAADQNSTDDNVIVTGLLTDLRDLVYSNRFDAAYNHAVSFLSHHHPKHQDNIYILMDLAAIQYHRGEYQNAYDLSKYIISIVPTHYLAYACLGVSAVYLGQVDDAIHAYHTAYTLLTATGSDSNNDKISDNNSNSMNTGGMKYTSMIFSLTIEAIQFNLVTALYAFKRYNECIYYAIQWIFPSPLPNSPSSTTTQNHPLYNTSDVAASDVAVSAVSFGQAAVITLSTVQWSEARYNDIALYESTLREKGLYGSTTTDTSNTNSTLINEIVRVQTQYNHILNAVVDSLMHILSPQDRINIMTDLTHLIELADVAVPGIDTREFSTTMYILQIQSMTNITIRNLYKQKGIVLISQYYTSNDIQTQYDMNKAFINNLLNPYITEIHLLLEEGEKETDTTQNYDLFFSTLPHYFKIKMFRLGHRMTFADAFVYANRELIGRTVILGMYA